MTDLEIRDEIKKIVNEECRTLGFSVLRFILFGSRARKDNKKDSDWDLIVVLNKAISWKEKMKLWLLINRRIAKIKTDVDILFKSEQEYENDKKDIGKTTYYANKEGVLI